MNAIDTAVAAAITARGISRITHFTQSRNLPHIFHDDALRATGPMRAAGDAFESTDRERWDGKLDYICCNIEYPNMYYFATANQRPNAINYSDWVVLLLDPMTAATPGALFAPRNAAKNGGAELRAGVEGLDRQYAPAIDRWGRSTQHFPASPTDVQAEVLIPGEIPLSAVLGIVVPDEASLRRELGRLRQLGYDPDRFNWYVGIGMFNKSTVTNAVRQSRTIELTGPCDTQGEEAP